MTGLRYKSPFAAIDSHNINANPMCVLKLKTTNPLQCIQYTPAELHVFKKVIVKYCKLSIYDVHLL